MKAVVLLSGDIKSAVLLQELHNRNEAVRALTFNIGQESPKYINAAHDQAERLAVPFQMIDLLELLTFSTDRGEEQAIPPPNIGMIMIAVAASCAITAGYDAVAIAARPDGEEPERRLLYMRYLDSALKHANKDAVSLYAPHMNFQPADIIQLGRQNGTDFALSWSCQVNMGKHCGTCTGCKERRQMFADAKVKDSTEYIAD